MILPLFLLPFLSPPQLISNVAGAVEKGNSRSYPSSRSPLNPLTEYITLNVTQFPSALEEIEE